MPVFPGIKSFLTTDRSSITKQETARIRRIRLNKSELLRENLADRLKCPLFFCIPCLLAVTFASVAILMYVTLPYIQGECVNVFH